MGCGNSLLWESKAHIDDAMVHHGDIFFKIGPKLKLLTKSSINLSKWFFKIDGLLLL